MSPGGRRLLALLGVAAAAGLSTGAGGSRDGEELTVFAAASLTEAFTELGLILERAQPGTRVRFNFAGSQQLAVQIEQGAGADVFASADQSWMSYVRERDLVSGESQVFAGNRLVVIVPKANPGRVVRLEDLTRRGLKLVLAAEAVPAGRYSREAVKNLARAPGFPPDFAERVLANAVSEEENVKAVVAKVRLGEADAGLVYRSDVTPAVAPHLRVLEIPGDYNVVASYPIAVLRDAGHPEAARAFLALVLGAEGQRVLQRHGFIPAGTG